MLRRIVTIGVYGFDERGFFDALKEAGVDTFCDIRYRRGVRGKEYAFANRRRLEARLAAIGIAYLHFRQLAPGPALRRRQTAADQALRVGKRQRAQLSGDFIAGYQEECLKPLDSRGFVGQLGPTAQVIALFCVEREPAACHRSLLADRLRDDLGIDLVHLTPGGAA